MPIFNGAPLLLAVLEAADAVVVELEADDVVAALEPDDVVVPALESEVFVVFDDDEQALNVTSAAAASDPATARRLCNLIGTSRCSVDAAYR